MLIIGIGDCYVVSTWDDAAGEGRLDRQAASDRSIDAAEEELESLGLRSFEPWNIETEEGLGRSGGLQLWYTASSVLRMMGMIGWIYPEID